MKIATVGDIHGNPKIVSSKSWLDGKEYTEDDLVIFLGDFGLYFNNPPDKSEKYWLNWLASKPYQVAFLDGNHENFDLIEQLPISEKWGGLVQIDHRFGGDIIRLRRGEVYKFDPNSDDTYFVMGGGLSIDKHLRTPKISWWAQEEHSKEEEENALNNLDKVNWSVTHVLTHTCPDSVIYAFLDNPNSEKFRDPVSRFFEFIDNRLEYKLWSFGHMHNDRLYKNSAGDEFQCHYKIIRELTLENK